MSILLLDIGGTNFRYSLVKDKKKFFIKKEKVLSNISFDKILKNIIKDLNTPIKYIVISAAGPKIGNVIKMTNQKFEINSERIKSKYKLKKCFLLNDLEAASFYLNKISLKDQLVIKKGKKFNDTKILVSPGTGLGLSLFLNKNKVLPTEIGNSKILISELTKKYKNFTFSNISSIEDIISGPGLENLYHMFYKERLSTKKIIELGGNKDKKSSRVINVFLEIMAKFLSEISLVYLPGNGIFLSGNFIRQLEKFISKKNFSSHFLSQVNKTHKHLVKSIQISLVRKEHMPLYGCLEYINLTLKDLN